MIIVAYDISNDKVRTRFSKFLQKFGRRIQYSVFEIRNSKRILDAICIEVEKRYEKHFTGADSVIIYRICSTCKGKVKKFGYAENDDNDIIFL